MISSIQVWTQVWGGDHLVLGRHDGGSSGSWDFQDSEMPAISWSKHLFCCSDLGRLSLRGPASGSLLPNHCLLLLCQSVFSVFPSQPFLRSWRASYAISKTALFRNFKATSLLLFNLLIQTPASLSSLCSFELFHLYQSKCFLTSKVHVDSISKHLVWCSPEDIIFPSSERTGILFYSQNNLVVQV